MGTSISAIIHVTTSALGVPPGPPTAVQVTNVTVNSLQLSWTPPSVGDPQIQYQVFQGVVGGPLTPFGGPTVATTVSVTGLLPATMYNFDVVAQNGSGSATSALTPPVTTLSQLPSAPTNLSVVGAPTLTDVVVSWLAPAVGSTPLSYQVSFRTPPGSGPFTPGPTTSALQVDVGGLSPATLYDFEVAATNLAGTGPPSAILAGVLTATGSILPSAPQNLSLVGVTPQSVTLGWTPPAQGTGTLSYTLQFRPH